MTDLINIFFCLKLIEPVILLLSYKVNRGSLFVSAVVRFSKNDS